LLGADQLEIGSRYSKPGSRRFAEGEFFIGPEGVPLIKSAVFHIASCIQSVLKVGGSDVFFASVIWGDFGDKKMPLRYWSREFISR
jgi:flavin reductase (DIM6/NTAB) family NADH-FMN oxidoreductase RutF